MSSFTSSASWQGFAKRKLLWVGPLAIVVAVLVNLLLRSIAVAFFSMPDAFVPLQAIPVIGTTIFFLLLALLAFALVGRFARRPLRFYQSLVVVALLISFLNPVMALSGFFPVPGMHLHIFWTMIVIHCATALITVSLFTGLAVETKSAR